MRLPSALLMWLALAVVTLTNVSLATELQNPLEKVNVLGTTIDIDNAIKLQVNTTRLNGARGDWVEVRLDSAESLLMLCQPCPSLHIQLLQSLKAFYHTDTILSNQQDRQPTEMHQVPRWQAQYSSQAL